MESGAPSLLIIYIQTLKKSLWLCTAACPLNNDGQYQNLKKEKNISIVPFLNLLYIVANSIQFTMSHVAHVFPSRTRRGWSLSLSLTSFRPPGGASGHHSLRRCLVPVSTAWGWGVTRQTLALYLPCPSLSTPTLH